MKGKSGKGVFVVIEGVGGAGKSTVMSGVGAKPKNEGYDVLCTREPGGVECAEDIRDLIFKLKRQKLIGSEGQNALFNASRYLWLKGVVAPAINKGKIVLADRSFPSTNAYQGFAEGGDSEQILQMTQVVMGKYMPDLIILLDVDAKVAIARNQSTKAGDPFDDEGADYIKKLVGGYRQMASQKWSGVDWVTVDASQTLDKVIKEVWQVIRDRIDR